MQRNLVFLPFIRMPKNVNFSDPASEVGRGYSYKSFVILNCELFTQLYLTFLPGPSWHKEFLLGNGLWGESRSVADSSCKPSGGGRGEGVGLVG